MSTLISKGELSYRLFDVIIYSICMIKIIVKMVYIQYCIPLFFVLQLILSPYSNCLPVKAVLTRLWLILHYIIIFRRNNLVKYNLIQKINVDFTPKSNIYPFLKISLGNIPQQINDWNYPFFVLTDSVF